MENGFDLDFPDDIPEPDFASMDNFAKPPRSVASYSTDLTVTVEQRLGGSHRLSFTRPTPNGTDTSTIRLKNLSEVLNTFYALAEYLGKEIS